MCDDVGDDALRAVVPDSHGCHFLVFEAYVF